MPSRGWRQVPIAGDSDRAGPIWRRRDDGRAEPEEDPDPAVRAGKRPRREVGQVRTAGADSPVQQPSPEAEDGSAEQVGKPPIRGAQGQVGKDDGRKSGGGGEHWEELGRELRK